MNVNTAKKFASSTLMSVFFRDVASECSIEESIQFIVDKKPMMGYFHHDMLSVVFWKENYAELLKQNKQNHPITDVMNDIYNLYSALWFAGANNTYE